MRESKTNRNFDFEAALFVSPGLPAVKALDYIVSIVTSL